MILSVSRRTDIPNYYANWFFNRIREGYVYVRNPMNAHQISKIDISPDIVDCIVFWTKNPENMIERLDELDEYKYYFQFTLTGYGKDIEANIPDKKEYIIPTFKKLSEKIGKNRVIWRYDPIIINQKYTIDYHVRAFKEIARSLEGYTSKVIISFLDLYDKTKRNMSELNISELSDDDMLSIAKKLVAISQQYNLEIESCAEQIELKDIGIKHGHCIDQNLIEDILGCKLKVGKDKNQREDCGCIESIDIGTYNTCFNGCKYCYANFNDASVKNNKGKYNVNSPLLCGNIGDNDKITERKVKSQKNTQLSLFDVI